MPGGKRKIAQSLPGFYSPGEAMKRIGITDRNMFKSWVRSGRLKEYHPGGRKTAMFVQKEVDTLADEVNFFLLQSIAENQPTSIEVRIARPADTPGIVNVLTRRGWQTATALQRVSWYDINPRIDYIILIHGEVVGYIHAVPYTPDALADMMSGRRRSWNISPIDILPYHSGKTYDIYIGIAVHQDIPHHTMIAARLMAGFTIFLRELAEENIRIHRMYAVSAEPDGQRLCDELGFTRQAVQKGDLFPRYVLDLETSPSRFAKQYRKAIQEINMG